MENDTSRVELVRFVRDMIMQRKGSFSHEDVITLHILRKVIERMDRQEFHNLRAEAVLEILASGSGLEYVQPEAVAAAAKWAVMTIKELKGQGISSSHLGPVYDDIATR